MDIATKLSAVVEHHRRGEYDQAGELCHEILRTHPNQPDALHLLGVLAGRQRDYPRAIELLNRAIEANGQQPVYFLNLAKILRANGSADLAIDAYRRSISLDPHNSEAHSDLGAILHESGELDRAVTAYRRALQASPGRPRILYNLGVALRELGEVDAAIDQFERMLETVPKLAAPRLMLAGLRLEKGDVEAALEACERSLRQEKRNRLALALKSVALARSGDVEGSRALLDFDRLVDHARLAPPEGFDDIESFNAALAVEVKSRLKPPTVREDTRRGTFAETDEILDKPTGLLTVLASEIHRATQAYLEARPRDRRHPYLAWRPRNLRIVGRGLVLEAGGRLESHLREESWVSGLYLVSGGRGRPTDGGFEIGRPPARYAGDATVESRRIPTDPGLLTLFPAFFFQSAGPVESGQELVAIEFHGLPETTSERWW